MAKSLLNLMVRNVFSSFLPGGRVIMFRIYTGLWVIAYHQQKQSRGISGCLLQIVCRWQLNTVVAEQKQGAVLKQTTVRCHWSSLPRMKMLLKLAKGSTSLLWKMHSVKNTNIYFPWVYFFFSIGVHFQFYKAQACCQEGNSK